MVCSVIWLNSCFSQLNTKSFCILTLKVPFRKCVTYALGCSFIQSSLLRRTLIVCCQLNNIKQHAWWIKKKYFKEKKGFKVKVFRIEWNICDGDFWWKSPSQITGGNAGQSWGRSPSLGFVSLVSQTPKLEKYIWYK